MLDRRRPDAVSGDPDRSALVVVGVALLAATPSLPWYPLLLLALAARVGRPERIGVVAAATVSYLGAGAGPKLSVVGASAYGAGLLIPLAGNWWRLTRGAAEDRPSEPLRFTGIHDYHDGGDAARAR